MGNYLVPSSQARCRFVENSIDLRDYLHLQQEIRKIGSKHAIRRLYVLDKSFYVLIASMWEAYCEDIAEEGVRILTDHASTWTQLPAFLAGKIEKEIKDGKADPWVLADDGWKSYAKGRIHTFHKQESRNFSSPKTSGVSRLMSSYLGLENISKYWSLDETEGSLSHNLDKHLEKRNEIVHRIQQGKAVEKREVNDFYSTVRRLVRRTDLSIENFLRNSTGRSPWSNLIDESPQDK